jgi:hypothetical protein
VGLRSVLGLVSLICWGVGSLVIGLAQEPAFVTAEARNARSGPPDAPMSQDAAGTPSRAAPSVVVAAVGDIACGQDTPDAPCRDDSVARLTASLDPDAVLLLGDIQYECGELSDFETFFDRFWGSLKPWLHPAIGHHEYGVDDEPDDLCYGLPKGAPGYWAYFGDAATPREPGCRLSCAGYFSFDLGAWHLIALNSVCSATPGGCEAGSPQNSGCALIWPPTPPPVPWPSYTTRASVRDAAAIRPRFRRSGTPSTTLGPTWSLPHMITTTSGSCRWTPRASRTTLAVSAPL